jgi:hypothetical protein
VFVARTASGRQTRSSSAKSSRFGPSSSTIASITTSQSANAETSVVRLRRPMSKESIWPFSTLRVEEVLDPAARLVPQLVGHLAADGLEARLDRELRDARAHRPQPHHSDLHEGRSLARLARDGAPPARA